MYKLLLTFRYLRRRLIPVFALLAVMLCTAMVIIVISVMGGFLDLLRDAGKTLIGDVSINNYTVGFPHYEELIAEIEKLPETEAATPLIHSIGILKLSDRIIKGVEVYGVDGTGMERVTGFRKTLHWTRERLAKEKDVREVYGEADPVDAALKMELPWKLEDSNYHPIVLGLEVSPGNIRTKEGTYEYDPSILGMEMTLTVVPVTERGGLGVEPQKRRVIPINEFNSGVYDVDSQRVFIPFDLAQKMTMMHGGEGKAKRDTQGEIVVDKKGNAVIEGKSPPRCSWVYIRAKDGVNVDEYCKQVKRVYAEVAARHGVEMPLTASIETWVERQAGFLGAVENERRMMAVLFGIISITAVMVVGVIFYMIVLEKTRDIGTLRALGASAPGVASIFVTFAGVVGTLGATFGFVIAYLFVTNINAIHDWLGRAFGIVIWDRKVYFFDQIPSRVDFAEASVIVAVAIVASLIGAIIPAIKAARVDPVESLRYE